MQAVKVTMSTPEFLERFFGLWHDQAEVLAAMMGYKEVVETPEMEVKEWVQERLQAFEIIKSLHEAPDLEQALAGLNEKQYLALLNDQSMIEKALAKQESELVANASESDNSTHASVEKSIEASASVNPIHKEQNMTKEIKVDDTTKIEKSATELSLELLQKSFDESRVELQKAQELIAEFKKEKQEQIVKSKTAQFTAVIKDEKLLAPIVKAALTLESEDDFASFLAAITSMQANIETTQGFIEKSALFQEQGASTSEEPKEKESAVARILKSKQTK